MPLYPANDLSDLVTGILDFGMNLGPLAAFDEFAILLYREGNRASKRPCDDRLMGRVLCTCLSPTSGSSPYVELQLKPPPHARMHGVLLRARNVTHSPATE